MEHGSICVGSPLARGIAGRREASEAFARPILDSREERVDRVDLDGIVNGKPSSNE